MPESPGLRTLERGLSVLELLGAVESGLPVSEVAQRLKLPMGTTHRLLQTLMHAGYVEQDPRTRRYELGLKILELRGAIGGAMRIAAEARPFLRDLMLRTGLRAHVAMYRGGGVVYIDRVDNAATLNQFVPVGRRAHAHATGLGKALLAHASEDELAAFLAHHDLRKFTPTTLTDAGKLRDELAAVRRRGFALDRGESHPDTRCVASPVFDYTGRAIAAVSVAGAPDEVEPRSSDLAQIVMELAGALSQQFGYRSPGQPLLPGGNTLFVWESGPTNASQGAFDE